MPKVRKAAHAGSWYKSNGDDLRGMLSDWLERAGPSRHGPARAIIAPHAGYSYCGECAAHAYKEVDPENVDCVFILGPSHHVRLSGCALSPAQVYQTPLYDLPIDQEIYGELHKSGYFEQVSIDDDEEEHSLEMHLPYIARVMERRAGRFTIIPVIVGSLSVEKERLYGELFSKYLADARNLFVISSDFCHWGERFHYTHYDRSCGEIWQSIENLDRMAMSIVETMNAGGFSEYLQRYQNTICGRHPIGVLLNAIHYLKLVSNGTTMSLNFLKYAQSSRCRAGSDSSVSYAAASFVVGGDRDGRRH